MRGGFGGGRSGDELRGGSSGQMKLGERISELRSYFQRAPNPVRGPDGGAAPVLCCPRGPGRAAERRRGRVAAVAVVAAAAGADDGVVGESLSSVVWARALINCIIRGCGEPH